MLHLLLVGSLSAWDLSRSTVREGVLDEKAPTFCDPNVQQYSGYFNLTTGDKHYVSNAPCCTAFLALSTRP